jgi:hypothetical protein
MKGTFHYIILWLLYTMYMAEHKCGCSCPTVHLNACFQSSARRILTKFDLNVLPLEAAPTNHPSIHPSIHPFIHPSNYRSTALCWALAAFSVSWSFYTVGRTPWTEDQPVARPLPAHRTAQTQHKHTQTSMSWGGFGPKIPVFKRAKTVHALERTATVIGCTKVVPFNFINQ